MGQPNPCTTLVQPRQLWLSTRHCPHLLLSAVLRRRCCCRSIYPARTALSSKPAARRCCGSGSDRRTLDRFVAPAPHTMRVVSIKRVVLILRHLLFSTHYSALGKEAELRYACLSVCLSLCLLASISQKQTVQTSPNFRCPSAMAVAWFCSGGVAIWCVLPGL